MKATLGGIDPLPTRELLREAECRANAIRKLLKKLKQGSDRRVRGIMEDACRLAVAIEHLARRGQSSTAAEAVELEFHIEYFTTLLEGKLDQIFAS
jgi:hypothetical protein